MAGEMNNNEDVIIEILKGMEVPKISGMGVCSGVQDYICNLRELIEYIVKDLNSQDDILRLRSIGWSPLNGCIVSLMIKLPFCGVVGTFVFKMVFSPWNDINDEAVAFTSKLKGIWVNASANLQLLKGQGKGPGYGE